MVHVTTTLDVEEDGQNSNIVKAGQAGDDRMLTIQAPDSNAHAMQCRLLQEIT